MPQKLLNSPGSIGGGSGTQLGGAIGGETGSWWSLEEGPDSWRPKPAARRERLIISLKRKLQKPEQRTLNNCTPTTKYRSRKYIFIMYRALDCNHFLRPFLLKFDVVSFVRVHGLLYSKSLLCLIKRVLQSRNRTQISLIA